MPPRKGGKKDGGKLEGGSSQGPNRGAAQNVAQASPSPELAQPSVVPSGAPDVAELSRTGSHWPNLLQQVREVFRRSNDGEDEEFEAIYRAHGVQLFAAFDNRADDWNITVPPNEGSDTDSDGDETSDEEDDDDPELVATGQWTEGMIARLLDSAIRGPVQSRPSARLAAIIMIESNFDMALALRTLLNEMQARTERVVQDAREEHRREQGVGMLGGNVSPEESSDLSEESSSSSEESGAQDAKKKEAKRAALRELNPDVDRKMATRGQKDESKTTIALKLPGGRISRKHFSGTGMDWTKAEDVWALNRWRWQYLMRKLGATRPPRVRFHPDEVTYMTDYHREYARQAGGNPDWKKMPWTNFVRDFNRRFEGTVLPGSSEPRPHRTENALRSQRGRIREITDMTGLAPKDYAKSKGKGIKGAGEKEGEDDGKDEGAKKRGGRGGGSGRGKGGGSSKRGGKKE